LQFILLGAIALGGWFFGGAWSGTAQQGSVLIGGLLIVGGLAIAVLGVANLGPSMSAMPRPADQAVQISHGVYSQIRHPIYAGLVCAAVGWSVLSASFVALALSVVLAIVLDLKARREELWLRERFAGYAAYAGRTKRFMPGIY
jgi:protein-S-isoprenylcysteine O-methyltransferase Ste14